MGPLFLGVVLALATTCIGGIVQEQPRVKRSTHDSEVSGMVKTFELDGVRIKLNLVDADQPMKGGTLHLFSKYIDIFMEMEPSRFKFELKYDFEHEDDRERGSMTLDVGKSNNGKYFLTFNTDTGPSGYAKPFVPKEISNMALQFKTDEFTSYEKIKSTLYLKNTYYNYHTYSNMVIDPFKSIKFERNPSLYHCDGSEDSEESEENSEESEEFEDPECSQNIEFRLLTSFGEIEEKFTVLITGFLFPKDIVGTIEWRKDEESLTLSIQDWMKINSIVKINSGMYIKFIYEFSNFNFDGDLEIKYDNNTLKLLHSKLYSPIKNSLTIKVIPGQSLDIEETRIDGGRLVKETVMTYKTKRTTKRTADVSDLSLVTTMTLDEKSKLFWIFSPIFGHFKKRVSTIKVFVDKKNSSRYSPKFKIEARLLMDENDVGGILVDTTVNPYKFSIDGPYLLKRLGINQPSIDATVDHQLGHSLEVNANVLGGLHLGVKVADKNKTGHDMNVLIKKGDVEILKL